MYLIIILTLDGNVYNFFSPDDSALDIIKKSNENQNVYKVNAEDVNFFFIGYRMNKCFS
jgi:hypothetical protein